VILPFSFGRSSASARDYGDGTPQWQGRRA
jgi:hypothetical protein